MTIDIALTFLVPLFVEQKMLNHLIDVSDFDTLDIYHNVAMSLP